MDIFPSRSEEYARHLIDGVLSSPGETSYAQRQAIAEQAAQESLRTAHSLEATPPALAGYIKKVALGAYKITDADVEALKQAGYNEDAIFEITLSAALGAGMIRLERGLAAMRGESDAS